MKLHDESLPKTDFFGFYRFCQPVRSIRFVVEDDLYLILQQVATGRKPNRVASSPSPGAFMKWFNWSHGKWCFWLLVLHTGIIDLYYLVFSRDSYDPLYWKHILLKFFRSANHMSCGNVSIKIVSELPDHHCHHLFRQENTQPIVVGDGRFTCSKENVKKHIQFFFWGGTSLGEEPQEGWWRIQATGWYSSYGHGRRWSRWTYIELCSNINRIRSD